MSQSNRAEYLTEQSRSRARAWSEFLRAYRDNPTYLHCFYEGKDDRKYYSPRIKSVVFDNKPSKSISYWCRGKDKVLELHGLLSTLPKYKEAWVACFVDRDFDDNHPISETLYITPCYSIENFYITRGVFEQILEVEFNIPQYHEDFEATVKLFEKLLEDFLSLTDQINAWIYLQRKTEKASTQNAKLRLNNLQPKDFINVSLNEVKLSKTFIEFKSHFDLAHPITNKEVNEQVAKFRQGDRRSKYRGKYLIYFFVTFLQHLAQDRRTKDGKRLHFQEKDKILFSISTNIISELTQYAETPPCLHKFLSNLREQRLQGTN